MIRISLILGLLVCAQGAFAQKKQSTHKTKQPANSAVLVFDTDTFDFGTIYEGEKVVHVFKFKNTGNKPLLIKEVNTSCGCTTPSWTKEPVEPGAYGELRVEYDSAHRPGEFDKFVTIKTNVVNAPLFFVVIKGKVLSK